MSQTQTQNPESGYAPKTTIFQKGAVTVETYDLEITDNKTKEKKQLEMVKISKTKQIFTEEYGYVDKKSSVDISASVFSEMLHVLAPHLVSQPVES